MHLIKKRLIQCQEMNLWRKREMRLGDELCFRGNDYLGLAHHPQIIVAFKEALEAYGVGSKGSALLGGYHPSHQALEEALALFMGFPKALVFSTGYMANLAVITTLAKTLNLTEIFSDRLNHASIYDGILLGHLKLQRFKHKDYQHLNTLLTQSSSSAPKLCYSEGVFSVDGDVADLPEMLRIIRAHSGMVVLDDAHGFGVLGENGRGTLEHHHLSADDVPLVMGTFGKALGTFGAFVVGTEDLIQLLIQYARSYIFTTALPPALAASTLVSLKVMQAENWRREYLKKIIKHFRYQANRLGIPLLPSSTPIQLIFTYDPHTTVQCYTILKQKGCWVGALRPPTVPEGLCRLRINLTASHCLSDINRLLEALTCIKKFI